MSAPRLPVNASALPLGARYEVTPRGRCAVLSADLAIAAHLNAEPIPTPRPARTSERIGRLYVAAMCGDDRALGEVLALLTRYAGRVLARRYQLDTASAQECASDAATDVLLAGRDGRTVLASDRVAAYVCAATRYLWLNRTRATRRRGGAHLELTTATDVHVAEHEAGLSESARRAHRGDVHAYSHEPPSAEEAIVSDAIAAAERITATLPADDVLLLTWIGSGVTTREAGAWLGVSDATARKRVQRLRERCRPMLGATMRGRQQALCG